MPENSTYRKEFSIENAYFIPRANVDNCIIGKSLFFFFQCCQLFGNSHKDLKK